jgi:hypothetical protein
VFHGIVKRDNRRTGQTCAPSQGVGLWQEKHEVQYQLSFFDNARKLGSRGWRVIADWCTQLGIPKIRVIDSSSPRPLHNAYETVLAHNRGFVTMPGEDQDLSIA